MLATAGFIAQERRTPRPIIDLRFFRDLDFSLLNAGHAALNLAGFSVLLLVPFYLSRFGGLSAYATGLLLACSPAGTAVAAPLAARLATRVAPRLLALIGAGGMAVGQVLIGTADATPDIPVLAAAMALQGFGVGLFQVAYFDIVTASIPRSDRGVAGSLVMMTRTLGTVTGATVLMLLFQTWRECRAGGRSRGGAGVPRRLRLHVPAGGSIAGGGRAAGSAAWMGMAVTAISASSSRSGRSGNCRRTPSA